MEQGRSTPAQRWTHAWVDGPDREAAGPFMLRLPITWSVLVRWTVGYALLTSVAD